MGLLTSFVALAAIARALPGRHGSGSDSHRQKWWLNPLLHSHNAHLQTKTFQGRGYRATESTASLAEAFRHGHITERLLRPGVGCDAGFKESNRGACAVSPTGETTYEPPLVLHNSDWYAVACGPPHDHAKAQAKADTVCAALGHPEGASAWRQCSGLEMLPDGEGCGLTPLVREAQGYSGPKIDSAAWELAGAAARGCQMSSVTCKPSVRQGERCDPGFHKAQHARCRVDAAGIVRVHHEIVHELYHTHQQHRCLHNGKACICCDHNTPTPAPAPYTGPPTPAPSPPTPFPTPVPPTPPPAPTPPPSPCVVFGDGSLRSGTFFDENCRVNAAAVGNTALREASCGVVGAACFRQDATPAATCGGSATAGSCSIVCKSGFWRVRHNTCNNRKELKVYTDTCSPMHAGAVNYALGCCNLDERTMTCAKPAQPEPATDSTDYQVRHAV